MEAPKKIYVSIGPRQSLIAKAGQTLNSDIEYIRKDAMLEWAEKQYLDENASLIRRVCYKQLIDKLNSM